MRIMLVEDDYLQADWIRGILEHEMPNAVIDTIYTESEFAARLSDLKKDPPEVFVLDVILPWTDGSQDAPGPPPNTEEQGRFTGGIRCLNMLLEAPETRDIPVILYSVREREEIGPAVAHLPPHVVYLRKDINDLVLVRYIRSVLEDLPERGERGSNLRRSLWESIEVKPGWMGLAIDLKQLVKHWLRKR